MLRLLTKTIRHRAAYWLALAYLVCVIVPPVALTFADAATAAHCMSDDHMSAAMPIHGDGAMHEHAMHGLAKPAPDHGTEHQHSDGKVAPVNCCGMFCVTGAAVDVSVSIDGPSHGFILRPRIEASLSGVGPHRLDRPPNALASL